MEETANNTVDTADTAADIVDTDKNFVRYTILTLCFIICLMANLFYGSGVIFLICFIGFIGSFALCLREAKEKSYINDVHQQYYSAMRS